MTIPTAGRLATALLLALATPCRSRRRIRPMAPRLTRLLPVRRRRVRRGRRLPADSVTNQSITLPDGRKLDFTATAGSLPLVDEGGKLQAEIGYIAFTRPAESGRERPVTFAINGGPGAASAYLNIGAIGPWRLPLGTDTISPSQGVGLVPNDGRGSISPISSSSIRSAPATAAQLTATARNTGRSIPTPRRSRRSLPATCGSTTAWRARNFMSAKAMVGPGALIASNCRKRSASVCPAWCCLSPVLDFAWLERPRTDPWGYATCCACHRLRPRGSNARARRPAPTPWLRPRTTPPAAYLADL